MKRGLVLFLILVIVVALIFSIFVIAQSSSDNFVTVQNGFLSASNASIGDLNVSSKLIASNASIGDLNVSGNVGIGTQATATDKLTVLGDIAITGTGKGIKFPDGTIQTSAAIGIGGSGNVNTITKFTGASTIGNSVITESGGNVGIGTSTPGGKLGIATTAGNTGIRLDIDTGSGNAPFIFWKPNASNNNRFGIRADTLALRLGYVPDGGSFFNYLNIDTAGNVGIGTVTPSANLDVVGTVKVSSLSTINKIVCVKSTGVLGICSTTSDATGSCTCV